MTQASLPRRLRLQIVQRWLRHTDALTGLPKRPMRGMVRYGSDYGGWYLPQQLQLGPQAVVYAFGAGKDISFDLDLIRRHGCRVHVFDPVESAYQHVLAVQRSQLTGEQVYRNDKPGAQYDLTGVDTGLLEAHALGLWDSETVLKFFKPKNPNFISHSATLHDPNFNDATAYVELPVQPLATIMQQLGHSHIDLLKLDIEGAEYRVIDQMIAQQILPRILCLEVHGADLKRNADEPKQYLNKLLMCGYHIVDSDLYGNYTLLRG